MSQENVELAYRAYDAVNRRDLDGLLALMDDGVEAVSFSPPWRATITATLECVAGGRSLCAGRKSPALPTLRFRLSR